MGHTKGPWQIEDTSDDDYSIETAGGDVITSVDGYTSQADVQLIAAAPDLLEALQVVDRVMDRYNLPGPVYLSIEEGKAIQAAIAKTKGEE